MYYEGLKDHVKDEIARIGPRLEVVTDLIETAVRIDNQHYEQSLERRRPFGKQNQSN